MGHPRGTDKSDPPKVRLEMLGSIHHYAWGVSLTVQNESENLFGKDVL